MSTAVAKREPTESVQHEALQRIASQQTPKDEIRVRQGRGGAQLRYTDGAYVIRTLNQAFGWDWDFVADNEELLLNNGQPFEVKVRGILTVRLNGQAVTKTQFGCQPIEMLKNGQAPLSIGDCYKGAATDALKKCASMLGIALDLYDSDYKAEKYAMSEPEREPVRPVKLEAQQPKPQEVGPKTRDILNWLHEMNWGPTDLANYIYMQFDGLGVNDENVLKAIGALSAPQKNALHQMIKGEAESRRE